MTPELGHGTIMKVYNGIGPIKIDSLSSPKKLIRDDENAITKNFHLLAIDFPCNIGFLSSTSNDAFTCPEYPNQNKDSKIIDFDSLAITLAEGLSDFFETTNPECYLQNLKSLKIFIWTEGFGSQLGVSLKTKLEEIAKVKIKGLILGDPVVDVKRQSQNFASYGVGRSVISKLSFRELSKLESKMLLQELSNRVLCNMYRNVTSNFDMYKTCPYDLRSNCSALSNFISSSNNCDMFYSDKLETDVDNPLLKLLQDKMKIMRYQASSSLILWPDFVSKSQEPKLKLYNEKAIDAFVKVVNDVPVLLYQSQNNFIANSISSMLFADPLKWKYYDQYTSSPTQFIIDQTDLNPKNKYTIRSYGNLNRAQIFDVGGLYTFRENRQVLRDKIFKNFTDNAN